MTENIAENKMGIMPVGTLLVNMSLPIVISMFIQALYNVVDSYFVAKIGENALTAVSLAFPVQNLIISIAVGTGVGINSLLSKSLGEKNFALANKTANNGVFLGFASYIFMLAMGAFFSGFYFKVQTDIPEVVVEGTKYIRICTMLSIGVYGQITFERLLQATGKTFLSMVTQATGAVINIILDPILIFGLAGFPSMGVTGAAVATVFGQICSATIGIILNLKCNHEIKLDFKGFKPDIHIIKRIYSVGFPSILMRALTSVTTFGMNAILLTFSSTATAVFGVFYKLQSFVLMPILGLNNGMVPILAYNYGARKKERILKTIKLALTFGVCVMTAGLIVIQTQTTAILMLFNASDNMLAIGIPALRILSIHFLLGGFPIVLNAVFQAFGKGFYSLTVSLSRQLVILLPAAFVLSKLGGLTWVWWAFPIAEIGSISACAVFMHRVYIKQIRNL
ncbi:MAG: MATE family efflux transporter [Lachnospiraceae bacterium]|nr:MATE family efflux transporter [Lachnospiraceae bacterium]